MRQKRARLAQAKVGVLASDEEEPNLEATEATSQLLPVGMTETQIEEVTRLLRAGQRLSPSLLPHLFEVPREYELSYRGKTRRAEILAETMAMPVQAVRTFGQATDGWSNMLIFGDNLQVLRQLINLRDAGQLVNPDGSRGVRLCYIDPPFASAREFVGNRNERAYADRVAGAEFVEHLRKRLILIYDLLAPDGSLFVHLDTRKIHYIKVVLDEVFGEGGFRNEIIWKRTSAHNDASALGSVHETILYYAKGGSPTWNTEYVPYDRQYVEQYYRYKDPDGRRFMSADYTGAGDGPPRRFGRRGEISPPAGRHWLNDQEGVNKALVEHRIFWTSNGIPRLKLYLDQASGQPLNDVWTDILPVVSWSKERVAYPTQKPTRLISRIAALASNPGDIVLDAFVGSGTTLVAAQELEPPRRWIGIDSGKFAIYVAQARLLREAGKRTPKQGFTLYNAGLYDYPALRNLSWDRYRDFVLDLFQCRKSTFTLGGVAFQGRIADDPVLVYDFKKHEDGRIGDAYVQDLARLCGGRLGDRCFIIAPTSAIDVYEDYITVKDTRFFFLRIPYSIIADLYKKTFTELRQPTSEAKANAPIDSVGFDFVVPPRVECKYVRAPDSLDVRIAAFESEAFSAAESEENIANLAMVLIDYDYDSDVFDLDAVHFAEDLEKDNWQFSIPIKQAGKALMIVYVDLFGNEHRELKRPSEFVVETLSAPQARASKRVTARAHTPPTGSKRNPSAQTNARAKPSAGR